METNYPAVICQGKQQRGRGGPGQARDKQPSQATLFMDFLCISVFIWTFLSWRAGLLPSRMPQHLHSVGCHRRQVICLWGSQAKSWPWPGLVLPVGTRGLVSVSLGTSLFGLSRVLASEMEGKELDVQVMGRSGQVAGPCSLMEMEDAGVPGRSNGVGRHSGGLGAGGHWELFSSQGLLRFRGSLPLQQHALCLH